MAIITRRWNCGGLALLGGKASAKPASGSFKYGGNLDTRGTAAKPIKRALPPNVPKYCLVA